MKFQDNLFVIFCFKHFLNLLNEIKPWIFMEEVEDRQGTISVNIILKCLDRRYALWQETASLQIA